MKPIMTVVLTAVALAYFAQPIVSQPNNFIIDSDLLKTILSSLGLGDTNWEERLQIEGLGIAQAIIFLLQDKYPKTLEDPNTLKQLRILIVGSLGGNGLGGFVAATILSAWGIPCDLYVIQNEDTNGTPVASKSAVEFSQKLLQDLIADKRSNSGKYPNLNVVNSYVDPFKDLDSVDATVKTMRKIIADPNNPDYAKAFENAKNMDHLFEERSLDKNCPNTAERMEQYSLVLDGITGASQDNTRYKIGAVWAMQMLKLAETHSTFKNILVSIDVPSLWFNGKPDFPDSYKNFKLQPLNPFAIIHMGAMKPFVLEDKSVHVKNMIHYVVVHAKLIDALANFYQDQKINFKDAIDYNIRKIVTCAGKSTNQKIQYFETYLGLRFQNIIINIMQKTLDRKNEIEEAKPAPDAAVGFKYKDSLTAVSGFALAVNA